MKKQFLTFLGSAFLLTGYSQNQGLLPCNTYQAMEEAFQANPDLKLKYQLEQSQLDAEFQAELKKDHMAQRVAATTYSIPVVFHVMGPQTISDQVFINAIAQVNRDYSRQGSDTASIYPTFKSIYRDAQMVFVLAKRDPNGNCTNGIIRHDNESMYWNQQGGAYNYSGTGTNRWPREKYLNVYVVSCIYSNSQGITCPTTGGVYLGGYTYLPGSSPGASQDAIVYRASELNGLSARALSHEIGHWFNLQHTFGSTNSPGSTCGDDGVNDTPPTKGVLSQCPSSAANTCSGSGNLWNVENFMDYSSCPKNFTQDQITRMRAAAASGVASRNNLWSSANLIATGVASGYTCAPIANFLSNKQSVCTGNTVTFTDDSDIGASGSLSWTFQGGTPATSTASAPVVTYNTPGTYSVSLTATNSSGTNTATRNSYITVVQGSGGALLPDAHDFDAGTMPGITVVNANGGSVAWTVNTSVGAISTPNSIFLNNASQASSAGHVDYFETAIFDLSNTTNITLSYYYAYAKKVAAQADSFRVQYSLDCGGNWTTLLGVPNMASMASNSGGTTSSAFVPTAAQWKQVSLSPTILSAVNNKPSVKFRFWFKSDAAAGSSNNIYIDQINLSGAVGLNELEKSLDMLVYPNPTNASSTIEFNMPADHKLSVNVVDVVGRIVEASADLSGNGERASYVVNRNGSLAKGIYFINVLSGDQKVSRKLIIQ